MPKGWGRADLHRQATEPSPLRIMEVLRMRAELAWDLLGERLAEGLIHQGVPARHAERWIAEWRSHTEALEAGTRSVEDCLTDLVSMMTLARDLVATLGGTACNAHTT